MSPKQQRLGVLIVLLLTFGVYALSLGNGYTYDDRDFVMAPNQKGVPNFTVGDPNVPISELFTHHYGWGIGQGRGFRPITVLSFRIVHQIFKERQHSEAELRPMPTQQRLALRDAVSEHGHCRAWPHHLLSVLLHLLATFLAYLLLAPLVKRPLAALVAAAVFGVHALRSDSVISIIGRGEVMGFLWGAAATLVYARASRQKLAVAWPWLLAAAALFFLAFASKESALAWVAFAPLYVAALGWRDGKAIVPSLTRQAGSWALAVIPPTVVFVLLWKNVVDALTEDFAPAFEANTLFTLGFVERFPSAVMILGYGLYKVFAPFSLACDYSIAVFPVPVGFGDYRFLAAFAVLVGVLAGGLLAARRFPLLFLAMAVFLGFSFATSNIPFGIETIFGERLYYTPAMGLSFLVAFGLDKVRGHWLLAVVSLWILASGYMCIQRCVDWTENDTLFLADAKNQPNSLACQIGCGRYYRLARQKETDPVRKKELELKWERQLENAIRIDPDDPMPYNDMAMLARERNNLKESERLLRLAISKKHRHGSPAMSKVFFQLGLLLEDRPGSESESLELYRRAITHDPLNTEPVLMEAYSMALEILFRRRKEREFVQLLEQAARRFPNEPRWLVHRGDLLFLRGSYQNALHAYEQTLEQLPPGPFALRARGRQALILSNMGRKQDALTVLQNCFRLTGLPDFLVRYLQGIEAQIKSR